MFETFANSRSNVSFEDRWYQTEAEFSVFDYFESRRGKPGNPVVAMPTGTGKSVVIARVLSRIYRMFPNQRTMLLTHVKELIEQNAAKLMQAWPTAPLGIYSAGLRQRDLNLPITFGGVASVKNVIKKFGHIDLLFIDECHLLGPNEDTMYQIIIAELLTINPWLRVIGFTATPYRMKQGMITDGGIFTDICYDITGFDAFNRLVAEGFISPLIPKRTNVEIDLAGVSVVNGDYNQKALQAVTDENEITYAACKEMIELGENRKSWLVFASGVENAEHVAEMLQSFGISAAASHSKLPANENDDRREAFKRGELRALVNMGKYTTGFDHPPIDLIGMLRATLSPGLWVQMLGRGTRPSPNSGKENCLVLDFAGNTGRLGPINDPKIPGKPGLGGGDAPVRICKLCDAYNHARSRFCCNCGQEFTFESKIVKSASTEEVLKVDAYVVEYFTVKRVLYNLHRKQGSPDMIRVSYLCGFQIFNEYICLEHKGYAKHRAKEWWRQRHMEEPPETTAEALLRSAQLRVPSKIRVWVNKKPQPEVLNYEF